MVRFVPVSENGKTGSIPVSTTQSTSCPNTCPFIVNGINKCYAGTGNSARHWRALDRATTESGNIVEWYTFVSRVARLPRGQVWRHNEAGDLPAHDGNLDVTALAALVTANRGKRGFTYTHHIRNTHNIAAIRESNERGFTINISADSAQHAAQVFSDHGLPTVCVLPVGAPNVQRVGNVRIIACPHEKSPTKVKCSNCQLCAIPDRDYVIGFRAHSTYKKIAETIANGGAA
jgi:hypothetical protein